MKRETYNSYELYTKEEMMHIAKNEGFLFVETSNDDYYEIRKDDVADFIMLESERCGHVVDIQMYVPNIDIDTPFVSTFGCFLNKINQKFREEIINRLVELQTTDTKPRKIKVFDYEIFRKMTNEELGENENRTMIFNKFFKNYYEEQEELEA